MSRYTFTEQHCPETLRTGILKTINPICLDILYQRGFHTSEDMEQFLFPSLMKSIRNHPKFLDTDKAIQHLAMAAEQKSEVTIYHDYDADGITAAAIGKFCLEQLGIQVHLYCNNRITGGFGISTEGIEELLHQYPNTKIVLTVDNGITGLAGVQRAKSAGLTVLITDHHEPGETLPCADAVIDHKRTDEPSNQYRDSCGAGVIWETMLWLYVSMGKDISPVMSTLDLVALGTVADVVPLLGLNRAFVKEGMQLINDGKRLFFRELFAAMELQSVDSRAIGFRIAPMINAVSRMGHDPSKVVDLLLSDNSEFVKAGIAKLDEYNQARKVETDRESRLAKAQLGDSYTEPVIIFKDETFQEGIIGIIAGQLKELYEKPAIVFAKDKDGNWKGSCRSLDGFHLKNALDQCQEYLLSYGGHAKGAGVTVRASDFELFSAKMEQLARDAQIPEVLKPIDIVLPASAYTAQMVHELGILEPYGEGFQPPVFGMIADVVDVRYMGQESQHVKYVDKSGLSIILWNQGAQAKLKTKFPRKFVGTPQLNSWNGTISVQFIAS